MAIRMGPRKKNGRWTHRLIQDVEKMDQKKVWNTDFHFIQMITGHGCFGSYPNKYKKRLRQECVNCKALVDNAEHTLFDSDRWWEERKRLEVTIGNNFEVDTVIEIILQTRNN